jgi:putative Mg2+ transporter-C (MgtC) family protein
MEFNLTFTEIVIRLILAIVLGAVIGLEREFSGKPAGLRTHMMVSLGAAAFTVVTLQVFGAVMGAMEQTRADPIRIVEGIIGGIGFLGAGTIIRARGTVEGITTAAGIWVVGAVGLACGAGYKLVALAIVVFAVVIIGGIGRLEDRFGRKERVD